MFSWQPIKKFLCNLSRTDNISMMGRKTLAISLGQSINVAEIVLFCQTGIFPLGRGIQITESLWHSANMWLLHSLNKHVESIPRLLLFYIYQFILSHRHLLPNSCEVQSPIYAVLTPTLLDVTLMCIQKVQAQDFQYQQQQLRKFSLSLSFFFFRNSV